MSGVRVGFGIDVHRLGGPPPIVLGGVVVDPDRGVVATSDGDVATHAVIDALLGAAALGDLGTFYPSHDPRWEGARLLDLLADTVARLARGGFAPAHVDVTVIAQDVRVAPHREAMRSALAAVLGLEQENVSVKATTTDHLGVIGRGEGIAAMATASLR